MRPRRAARRPLSWGGLERGGHSLARLPPPVHGDHAAAGREASPVGRRAEEDVDHLPPVRASPASEAISASLLPGIEELDDGDLAGREPRTRDGACARAGGAKGDGSESDYAAPAQWVALRTHVSSTASVKLGV